MGHIGIAILRIVAVHAKGIESMIEARVNLRMLWNLGILPRRAREIRMAFGALVLKGGTAVQQWLNSAPYRRSVKDFALYIPHVQRLGGGHGGNRLAPRNTQPHRNDQKN
jgi:hypothetical protein